MIPKDLLIAAYAAGWFPMGGDRKIRWYSPDPRGIIPLDSFHVPRRLERLIRRNVFKVDVDRAFGAVIRACASVERHDEDEGGTWIDDEIIETYCALHELGLAHSVEAWQDDRLAGGLYGVALRGAFFGESMFHRVQDASKVALAALVERLRARGFVLLDTQWVTPHLEQFGAIEIPREEYLAILSAALKKDCTF